MFPFAVMLILQRIMGLDDNLMVAPRTGLRDGAVFNLLMVLVFWIGLVGYFAHTVIHANESIVWLSLKLAVLVGVILAMTMT